MKKTVLKSISLLSKIKQQSIDLANLKGHGQLSVISFPEKLLTLPYLSNKNVNDYLDSSKENDTISLYLHLPFCEKKCSFCNFSVSTISKRSYHEDYVNNLINQVNNFKDRFRGQFNAIDIVRIIIYHYYITLLLLLLSSLLLLLLSLLLSSSLLLLSSSLLLILLLLLLLLLLIIIILYHYYYYYYYYYQGRRYTIIIRC